MPKACQWAADQGEEYVCWTPSCQQDPKKCSLKLHRARRQKAEKAAYRKFPGNPLQAARAAQVKAAWESLPEGSDWRLRAAAADPLRKPRGHCTWCEKPILKADGSIDGRRSWHNGRGAETDCLWAYYTHTRAEDQLREMVARKGPCCAGCGKPKVSWSTTGVMNPDKVRDWGVSWVRLFPPDVFVGAFSRVHPAYALQVDHRLALAIVVLIIPEEDRWRYWGPMNLQLLCGPCHVLKTKADVAELKRIRSGGQPAPSPRRVPVRRA